VDSHLQSATRLHLDLACAKLTNTEVKLNDTDAKLNNAHSKLNETLVKLNETEEKLEATRKVVEKLETQIFIWRINSFSEIGRQATIDETPSKDSVPFYTDRAERYGYKLKVRIHPNGFAGSFVDHLVGLIFVMEGEYDGILPWPFKKKANISLIDQQEDPVERQNISPPCVLLKTLSNAIARPVKEENEAFGCFVIPNAKLHSRRYLVDDTLFIQVEISPR